MRRFLMILAAMLMVASLGVRAGAGLGGDH
jgi:hypothetical protein